MTVPDVSVIIPAYNALPWFHRCLDSLEAQTIGTDRMEIIVIDDGSTDGTAEEIDRRARATEALYRVEHHPASGGPAGPRNRGLDIATGRYVYFVDADDYLGVEALERLVAVADREGSDVVAGSLASDSERGVGASAFRKTDLDADLFTSQAYWSISVLKLYRRSMLEEHKIRFPTEFPVLSDQPFAVLAYLRAAKISLLADYEYYWVVLRDDGGNITYSGKAASRVDVIESMCALLVREVPDPENRGRLLARHFQLELQRVLLALPELDPAEQRELMARIRALVEEHLTPPVATWLSPDMRLLYHLVGRGLHDEVVTAAADESVRNRSWKVGISDGRAHALLPFFRDAAVGVPDEVYDVTERFGFRQHLTSVSWSGATLHLEGVATWDRAPADSVGTVTVRLHSRDDPGTDHLVTARRGEDDTFRADLDTLALDGDRLHDAIWDVYTQLTHEGLTREQQARLDEDAISGDQPFLHWETTDGWTVASYLSPGRRLKLDVGQQKHRVGKMLRDWQVSWQTGDLVVEGRLDLDLDAPLSLIARGDAGSVEHEVALSAGEFSGRIPVGGLEPGRWTIRLRAGLPPHHERFPVPAPTGLGSHTTGKGLRQVVTEAVTLKGGKLALDVAASSPLRSVTQALRQRGAGQEKP
ncbi:glycosyltransferase family 2 protein [Nocardioides jensenii]|uniref:glycosyltransferase family 2 protein n=1 Tax=Nocardioides jensenii TaxID=1843 RepID=UPI000A9473FC|nr:glycosyltransferase family A protein [Nocardioides jensenii]